jgi:poly-gamma-glutamate biosynthesis protein PgsC/CapC
MIDLITLSIALGLAVALIFSETTGKMAGGLVVPGYVALHLTRPWDVLLTLAAALATFAIVKGMSTVLIIYGRRRTVMMLIVGFTLGAVLRGVLAGGFWAAEGIELTVIGFIVPGLIAVWIDRQGWLDTCTTTLTAAAVTRLLLVVLVPQQVQLAELERREAEEVRAQMSAASADHAAADATRRPAWSEPRPIAQFKDPETSVGTAAAASRQQPDRGTGTQVDRLVEFAGVQP